MVHDPLERGLTSLFGEMEPQQLAELRGALETLSVEGGEYIFRAGDPGDAMYVLDTGHLSVLIEGPDGHEKQISQIERGEVFGELALLDEDVRSASVLALRDSTMVRLSRRDFGRFVANHPRALMRVMAQLARRLRRATGRSRRDSLRATIAVVPTSEDVPIRDVAQRLVKALSAIGRTEYMDNHEASRQFQIEVVDKPSRVMMAVRLDQLESDSDYIVYCADRQPTDWTRQCARQSDMIVLVGRAGGDPTPSAIETAVRESTRGKEFRLALLHPAGTTLPEGTAEWLRDRSLAGHHHLRDDVDGDYERLARQLAGKSIGLVLSGGGARGFAHLGVIRALEEAGIPIDEIGGTSFGGLVGAQHALGRDLETTRRLNWDVFVEKRVTREYILPLVGLVPGRKAITALESAFGGTAIEDLWLPFFCVSCDLTHTEEVVFDRGSLWLALRSTMALPCIGVPVFYEGRLLIDGGVMNNLPTDVMRRRGVDRVIAVDVGVESNFSVDAGLTECPNALQLLWGRLRGRQRAVPWITDVMIRSLICCSAQRQREMQTQADLVISPPVGDFKMLEFSSMDRIIEIGHNHASEVLRDWRP